MRRNYPIDLIISDGIPEVNKNRVKIVYRKEKSLDLQGLFFYMVEVTGLEYIFLPLSAASDSS